MQVKSCSFPYLTGVQDSANHQTQQLDAKPHSLMPHAMQVLLRAQPQQLDAIPHSLMPPATHLLLHAVFQP